MKLALIYPAAQFLIKSICLSLNIWHAQEDIFDAIYQDRIDDVAAYIQLIDVNTIDKRDGNTLLHQACRYAHSRIVEFLVKKGTGVNISNSDGFTPLSYIYNNYPIIVSSFTQESTGWKEEKWRRNKVWKECIIPFLIKNGADVSKNYDGYKRKKRIILHHPELSNDIEMVRLMLENGADVNSRDEDDAGHGHTLLHKAIWYKNVPMVKLLIEKGAGLDIPDWSRYTAFDLAAGFKGEIFELLNSERKRREELQKIENELQAVKSEIKLGNPRHLMIERKDSKVKDIYYRCNNQINQNNIPLAPIFSVRSSGAIAFLNHVQNN